VHDQLENFRAKLGGIASVISGNRRASTRLDQGLNLVDKAGPRVPERRLPS